jgi:hypothetical protein
MVGFVISMSTLNVAARYVALFLQASSYAGLVLSTRKYHSPSFFPFLWKLETVYYKVLTRRNH